MKYWTVIDKGGEKVAIHDEDGSIASSLIKKGILVYGQLNANKASDAIDYVKQVLGEK